MQWMIEGHGPMVWGMPVVGLLVVVVLLLAAAALLKYLFVNKPR